MSEMERHGGRSHNVRRVLLPGGKTIEVVSFREPNAASGETRHKDLHLCAECASGLVYPVQWEEADAQSWKVALRCPNCDTCREGVFSQPAVDALDVELDRGREALERDYGRLLRVNMAAEIERFVRALQADALLPEDF